MEWHFGAGQEVIGQRMGQALACVVEPIWQVVRRVRSLQAARARRVPPRRQRIHLPHRQPLQLAQSSALTSTVSATLSDSAGLRPVPGCDGKRKATPNEAEPMRSSKRRRFEFRPPREWEDTPWHKEHLKNLLATNTAPLITPLESPSPPRRVGARNKVARYSPYRRPTPQKFKAPKFYKDHPLTYEFLWSDEDEDKSPSPEPPEPQDTTMLDAEDELALTPQPLNSKEPTPPPSDSERESVFEDDFDDEESDEFRKYLRQHPQSFNEDGYRVPIHGIISPESKSWNAEHRLKLTRQAAAQNETPSKVPQPPRTLSPANEQSTPLKVNALEPQSAARRSILGKIPANIWKSPRSARSAGELLEEKTHTPTMPQDQDDNDDHFASVLSIGAFFEEPEPESSQVEEISAATSEAESPGETNATTPATQVDPPTPVKAEEEPITPYRPPPGTASAKSKRDLFETPANQLATLSLSERTPKASIYATIKTDRKTRRQQLLEEREAQKDKYKLVPLGPTLDAEVRKAVANGFKDSSGYEKYSPTDLSRVVPEYSVVRGHDNWLNDLVINDYLQLIVKHGNRDDRPTQVPSHAALASHAWTKINQDPKSLPTRWAKKQGIQGKNLLECEQIFIPINSGVHWTLCVVEPKTLRRVTVYNSMGSSRGDYVAKRVLDWCKHEVGATFNEAEWSINGAGVSPQQTNADDCGVFTITSARQIMLGQMDAAGTKKGYEAGIMRIQRLRVVAELMAGRLLTGEESTE